MDFPSMGGVRGIMASGVLRMGYTWASFVLKNIPSVLLFGGVADGGMCWRRCSGGGSYAREQDENGQIVLV
jgi:hypothetical protein